MGLNPERAENTRKNAAALTAMLDRQNLMYTVEEESDARISIRIHFQGEDLPLTLHIVLRTDRQIATVFSVMPERFPESRLTEAALAVAVANQGLIDGSFDLNMKTGEVRFRLTSSYIETVLSEMLFSYLMYVSAETVDRYNDRFTALSRGEADLAEFLRLEQQDAGTAG